MKNTKNMLTHDFSGINGIRKKPYNKNIILNIVIEISTETKTGKKRKINLR